jgi:hypothetical protein
VAGVAVPSPVCPERNSVDPLADTFDATDVAVPGTDTSVIGRIMTTAPRMPHGAIADVAAPDLTCASHGHAVGVGTGDVVPFRASRRSTSRPPTLTEDLRRRRAADRWPH